MRRFAPLASRTVFVRLTLGLCLAVGLAITTIQAQIPGRNVNMVSGTKWPEGDPFLQRQNEPSVAASTRNPLHLLGGSNDYRTVDVPGTCLEYGPDPNNPAKQICVSGTETGDAWLGLFKSLDGGQRWTSTLLPGYPQDKSPAGMASPLKGFQAGADAVVRAGTSGLLYFSGLVFDRTEDGKSGIFLARFIDNNNQEAGDPIAYLGTTMVAQSTGAKFLDKPWMAVDMPRSNAVMCTVTDASIIPTAQNGRRRRHGYDRHERSNNGNGKNNGKGGPAADGTQRLPAGAVYVAYSSITGDAAALRSEIYVTRSMDCGATWSAPMRVSRTEDQINQGASLTIDPKTGTVYIGWRRFDPNLADSIDLDAVMVARLQFGAKNVDPPGAAHQFPKPVRKVGRQLHRLFEHRENRFKDAKSAEANESLDQFDLGTTGYNFRTNAYPTMAADGTGRIYLAWTQRGFDANSAPADGARIVIASTRDGKTFTAPKAVDDHTDPGRGHQLMPSMAFAGGKLMLVFYDLRDSKANTHNRISSDYATESGLRQTIDIRSAMATPGDQPAFAPSVKVSDYLLGINPKSKKLEELQVNPPNLPMFKLGTVPFIGDYIDVAAAPAFIPTKNGKWEYNTASTGEIPVFHAVWTDNRDVRPPRNGEWWKYTPAKMSSNDTQSGASLFDPSIAIPPCTDGVGNPGSRNQNVYSARITGGLLAGSPGNAKPLSPTLQRGFVVFAQNTTADTKSFRMTILGQPAGGRASFDQFPLPPYTTSSVAPETAIEMIVPPRSTAARTVYVTSSDPDAQLRVDVSELVDLRTLASPTLYPAAPEKTGGLEALVVLNPDIENPDIENPDIENEGVANPDIENAEVYNPDIENPDIENPDIENPDIENVRVSNPDIENPDIENPDIENPDIENVLVANPDIENPDIENPDIENPDIENPDIENPDIENPDIENGSIADITWKVNNDGNTTASFNVNLFLAQQQLPTGVKTQLILLKTYRTPVTKANKCQLGFQTRNILLANIRNPQLVPPGGGTSNANDPAETNATLWLAPGEEGRIVLRVIDEDTSNNVDITKADGTTVSVDPSLVPTEDVSPVVQQQAVDSDDAVAGVIEPPVVPPPAPPATDDTVWTSPGTPVRINVLRNDSQLFGSTKILSAHPDGLAQNLGGFTGELLYMPTTGLLYAGSGRSIGVIDPRPGTNKLVGRIPYGPDLPLTYGQASASTGLLFFRMGGNGQPGASVSAFDARPGSPTFHQGLQVPPAINAAIDALGDTYTFTLDVSGKTVFYVAGVLTSATETTPSTATATVSAISIDPAGPGIGTILWTRPLPDNLRPTHILQNPASGKVYITALNTGAAPFPGGVYVMNPAAPAAPVRIAGIEHSSSLAINPATNLIFVAGNNGGTYRLNTIDGATDTLMGQVPFSSGGTRGINFEDRMAVHHATGRVFLRGPTKVFVFDGLKGSGSFNTLIATLDVGPEFGNSDMLVDQTTGVVAVAGNFNISVAVIDAATTGLGFTSSVGRAGGELALDAVNHRLFLADYLTTVHTYSALSAATVSLAASLEVAPETAQVLINPEKNVAYAASSGIGSTIDVITGSGVRTPVGNLSPETGRWGFGGRYAANNSYFFTNSGSNVAGDASRPGALVRINGTTHAADALEPTVGQPFGLGVNQATGQVYVVGLNGVSPTGAFEPGKIRVHSATNPAVGVDADLSGVPVNNPTSISFGRQVVINPVTNNAYVMVTSGSSRSVVVLPPTAIGVAPVAVALDLTALPGLGLTPDDRVEVIRANAAANLIYLGLSNSVTNTYRVLALNGTDHSLVSSYVGGGHSRMHTASWMALNAAGDRLYVVNYNADTVTMLNATTLAVMATTNLPDGPSGTAFNASQNRLYVASVDGKALSALNGTTLALISTVKLPLHAFFLHVNEADSRLFTSGGNSPDESGFMIVSDVVGLLGAPVAVTAAAASAGATATVNADYSVTYTPAPGFSGVDTFTYTAQTAAGSSEATVTVNVVPVASAPVAFSDAYSVQVGGTLNIGGRGVLANDVASMAAQSLGLLPGLPGLTLNLDGSFTYVPAEVGVYQFQYLVRDGADSIATTVSITVTAPPNPLIVRNTASTGFGSLRAALDYANATPGPQTITFAIPNVTPAAAAVINLQTPLPAITDTVTIDGFSQPLNGGVPIVEVTNNAGGNIAVGFLVNADVNSVTIRGLAVTKFQSHGILLMQADTSADGTGHLIESNYLGTDRNGTAGKGNATGIEVRRDDAQVLNNVISGNFGVGVLVSNDTDDANIAGNVIGLSPITGLALANSAGIRMYDYGSGVVINGNTISGNNGIGVEIQNNQPPTTPGVTGTRIISNTIGLNQAGVSVRNLNGGVRINNAPNTRIGEPGFGNLISGNTGTGVVVTGSPSPGTRIQAYLIGTNAAGDQPRGNSGVGIRIDGTGVEIGWVPGDGGNAGNVISGNGGDGIQLFGATNRVRGNLIGTDRTGTFPIGSNVGTPSPVFGNFQAIYITGASNTVGGLLPTERNILSGNRINGVFIDQATGNNNQVIANYIGTDITGTQALANGFDGIGVINAPNNTISGNVVSGNSRWGMFVTGDNAVIDGNTFGATVGGGVAPNASGGIYLSANGAAVGATTRNLIAFNGGPGVTVASGTGNRILDNSIRDNAHRGIDLAGNGVTANDAGDGDNGPNGFQNFPVLSNANNTGPTTVVTYNLSSFAPGTYTLRFFSSPSCDPSGHGEGETLQHTINANAGAVAVATFGVPVPTNHVLTATATDIVSNNTSEFSACVTVASSPSASLTAVSPGAPSAGQMATFHGTGLPAVTPLQRQRVFFTQGANTSEGFVFFGDSSKWWVRLPGGLSAGPATIYAATAAGSALTGTIVVPISATPAAPIMTAVLPLNSPTASAGGAVCGGGYASMVQTGTAAPGQGLGVVAYGTDTSGATVVFTQGATVIAVSADCATSSVTPGLGVTVTVPLGLSPGPVTVQVRQSIGANTSVLSAPVTLTVPLPPGSFFVPGEAGGTANTNMVGAGGIDPVSAGVVTDGQTVSIQATGFVSWFSVREVLSGPDGALPPQPDFLASGLPGISLIARIGAGPWQFIGSGPTVIGGPGMSGLLQLAVNDSAYGSREGFDESNTGGFNVTVTKIVTIVGPAGGTGGNAFGPVDCPSGSVVMGLVGRAGDDIDRTSLMCASLPNLVPTGTVFVAGGNGGADYGATLTCPGSSAVTGVFGEIKAPGYIDRLGVTCTNLATAAVTNLGPVGVSEGGAGFSLSCPAGKEVVGLAGRQGALMDQISIRCQ